MPWRETCAMTERLRFIALFEEGNATMAALCREFGISRKTGYQMLARYAAEGEDGLRDRSHAAHHHPHAMSETVEDRIVALRARHPTWGARKLRARLKMDNPAVSWPVASTIGDVLHRHGLVIPRRRRIRTPADTSPFADCTGPNDIWCIDYKGWFRTNDGRRCDPLTISDAASRFLLRCQAVRRVDARCARPLLEATFREYGLPWRSAATMARHLRAAVSAVFRAFRCGGSSSGSSPSASRLAGPRRTAGTSACTARCSAMPASRPPRTGASNSGALMRFAGSTTRNGPMKRSATCRRARSTGRRLGLTLPVRLGWSIPITGKSAWCARMARCDGAVTTFSSARCLAASRSLCRKAIAAIGLCISVRSCSAASITQASFGEPAIGRGAASRCARRWLRATPLQQTERSKMCYPSTGPKNPNLLPILPAVQHRELSERCAGWGLSPSMRNRAHRASFRSRMPLSNLAFVGRIRKRDAVSPPATVHFD
jgi:transposase